MRKRITSLFLVLALCLTLLPTTALAEEAGAAQETQDSTEVGDGYTIEEDTAVQGKGENDKAVQTVQALIDALPAAEDISDANADEVSGQLDAIDEAKQALTEEQAAEVDVEALDRFLASPLAQEIRQGRNILREYRFTLLMDERIYDPAAQGGDEMLDAAIKWGPKLLKREIDAIPESAGLSEYLVDEVMQASRRRFYKPEYIACPGCGRTMYDLQKTFEEVKARTSHLKGMVIAVMGCIVNGPGEMADADWGYVGEGGGRVSIYRKGRPVLRHVPDSEAIDRLLELIEAEA